MAKISVSKKPRELNLTRCQICVFHEIINLTDQMAAFLNDLCLKQGVNEDIKLATGLVNKWHVSSEIFISKATSLLDCLYSLERAYEEYVKLVANVNDLNNAKVIMASMLDRVRQIIGAFRAIR